MILGEAIIRATVDASGVEGGLNTARQEAERTANEINQSTETISAGQIALGNIISQVAMKAAGAIVNVAKQSIQYNAQMENYTARLTTALGSQLKAETAIADIKRDAANSVFDTAGLVEANALLMSTGINAEESRAAINALGVAVAASGGGNDVLSRMASNLQQIKNVGKATSMDIRQFAMAGIDIYGLLADYTGKSAAEVQNLEISYEMLTGALQYASEEGGKYFGAMEQQMSTFNGQIAMLKSNVDDKLGQAFQGISDTLTRSVLPAINDFVANADVSELTTHATALASAFGSIAIGLNATAIISKISAIGTALTGLMMNPAFLAAAAVAGLTVALIEGSKAMDTYTDSLAGNDGTIEDMARQLEELRAREAELNEVMKGGFVDDGTAYEYDAVRIAISKLETQMSETADVGVETFSDTSEAVEGIISEFSAGYQELMASYNEAYESTLKSVSGWFGVFEEVKAVVPASIQDMQSALQSQMDFNNQYAENLAYLKEQGLGDMATAFQQMGDEGAQYAAAMVQAYESGNEAQVQTLQELYQGVQESRENVSAELTDITGEFETAFDSLVQTAESAINDLELSDVARENAITTMTAYALAIGEGGAKAKTAAYSVGQQVAQALKSGISSMGTITIPISYNSGYPARVGFDYIPIDDFPMLLHKGERVLTASEAKAYNEGGSGGGIQITQNISATPQSASEFAATARAYFEEAKWAV